MKTKHVPLALRSSLYLGVLLVSMTIQASETQKPLVDERRPSILMVGQPSVTKPEVAVPTSPAEDHYAQLHTQLETLLKKADATASDFEALNTKIGSALEQSKVSSAEKEQYQQLQKLVVDRIKELSPNREALQQAAVGKAPVIVISEEHSPTQVLSNEASDNSSTVRRNPNNPNRTMQSTPEKLGNWADSTTAIPAPTAARTLPKAATLVATSTLKEFYDLVKQGGTAEWTCDELEGVLNKYLSLIAQEHATAEQAILGLFRMAAVTLKVTSHGAQHKKLALINRIDGLKEQSSVKLLPHPPATPPTSEIKLIALERKVHEAIQEKAQNQYLTLLGEVGRAKKEDIDSSINPSLDHAMRYNQLQRELNDAQGPTDQEESTTTTPASPLLNTVPHSTPKEPVSASPQHTLISPDSIPFADTISTPSKENPLPQEPATATPSVKDGEKAPVIDVVNKAQEVAPQPLKKTLPWFTRFTDSAKNNKLVLGCIGLTVAGLVGYRYGNNITKYFKKLSLVRIAR